MTLLGALVRARRGVELGPFFKARGWPWRSAYRDIVTLKQVGVPIQRPERGWYRVAEGWVPTRALDVGDDELAALDAARCVAPMLEGLETLWVKLSSGRQLHLPFNRTIEGRIAAIDYAPHRLTIATIQRAIGDHRVIHLAYRDAADTSTSRRVEPAILRWEPATETLYLVAWCRTRREIRTFAVHRIVSVQLTDDGFDQRTEMADQLASAFRVCARPTTEHVSLLFSPRVAPEVRERRWHPSQTIRVLDDGTVRLEMQIGLPRELERILLGFGPDVIVEEPTSLAESVQQLHAASIEGKRFGPRRPDARFELVQRTASR